MPTALRTIQSRFLAKTKRVRKCLLWIGATDKYGYGQLWVGGKLRMATHVALFLKNGKWPKHCALHKCDVPACVDAEHLFDGTKRENTRDMLNKGRHSHGVDHSMTMYKFTPIQVRKIRRLSAAGESRRVIARKFGVVNSTIHQIVVRKRYAEVI